MWWVIFSYSKWVSKVHYTVYTVQSAWFDDEQPSLSLFLSIFILFLSIFIFFIFLCLTLEIDKLVPLTSCTWPLILLYIS